MRGFTHPIRRSAPLLHPCLEDAAKFEVSLPLPCDADSATTKRPGEFCVRREGCQEGLAAFADDSQPKTNAVCLNLIFLIKGKEKFTGSNKNKCIDTLCITFYECF